MNYFEITLFFFTTLIFCDSISGAVIHKSPPIDYPPEPYKQLRRNDCKQGYWNCNNGWCIPYGSMCDGDDNCGDGSDEADKICKWCNDDNYWPCANHKLCIPIYFLCDGTDDCGDNSDEDSTRCNREAQLRLVDGFELKEGYVSGRVEVRRFGIWGTICDNNWDHRDAKVVCRMHGLEGPAIPYRHSYFGNATGLIWADDVTCTGLEDDLLNCKVNLFWHHKNCDHNRDVGVQCLPKRNFGDKCGQRIIQVPEDVTRIVNGLHSLQGEFPWQVEIVHKLYGHACGATIIDEFHVISAAHCYPENFTMPEIWIARVGNLKNDNEKDIEEEDFEIEALILHENYDKTNHDQDIALFKLKPKEGRGIQYGDYVQPACLVEENQELNISSTCYISGWGDIVQGARNGSDIMNFAQVPLVSNEYCSSHEIYGALITENMICAGYIQGMIDTCQGDSGGPLVCNINDVYTLVGVVSWGYGCANVHYPGVYTKLSNYISWIDEKIKE